MTLVVSRADARRARRGPATPSPVKAAALAAGIPVATEPEAVLDAGAELAVVVAFGRIVPTPVLDALDMVNLHFSLLPRWRGAAPVERAILAGDATTGVCLMKLEEALDTGPVYRRIEVTIGQDETAEQLTNRLAGFGSTLLLDALAEGLGTPVPQAGEATYAAKLTTEDLHLNWQAPAVQVSRVVRVGRAWTTFRGRRLLVLAGALMAGAPAAVPALAPGELAGSEGQAVVGTGDGAFVLDRVQPEGKRPLPAADWLRGARPTPAERLGEPASPDQSRPQL